MFKDTSGSWIVLQNPYPIILPGEPILTEDSQFLTTEDDNNLLTEQ